MILQSSNISINDLRVSCNRSIYKNLSLLIRIQNKQYVLIPQSAIFNGSSSLKTKFIDAITFQFDKDRGKYLYKKIQLQLKLTNRTGKIHVKIYPINLNEFNHIKKGIKSKVYNIYQRLYSLQLLIMAKLDDADSPFVFHTNDIQRVRSEKRFQKSPIVYGEDRKLLYNSKSPDNALKNIKKQKIIVNQQIDKKSNEKSSKAQSIEKQVVKQSFEYQNYNDKEEYLLKTPSISSYRNSFRSNSRVGITSSHIEAQKTSPQIKIKSPKKNFQRDNVLAIQQFKKQIQNYKLEKYRMQKQIAGLKNKIEHLYHEKNIINKQKQQQRFIFQTKDKEQKIKQRKDTDYLKRQYETIIAEKQKQFNIVNQQLKQFESEKPSKQTETSAKFKFSRENNQSFERKIPNYKNSIQKDKRKIIQKQIQYLTEQEKEEQKRKKLIDLVNKQKSTYQEIIQELQQDIKNLEYSLESIENEALDYFQQLQEKEKMLLQKDELLLISSQKNELLESQLNCERVKLIESQRKLSEIQIRQQMIRSQLKIPFNERQLKNRMQSTKVLRSYSLGSAYQILKDPFISQVKLQNRNNIKQNRYSLKLDKFQRCREIIYIPAKKYYITDNSFNRQIKDRQNEQNIKLQEHTYNKIYSYNSPYSNYYKEGYFGQPLNNGYQNKLKN